jgi:branched-chain amino acid transport system permease protein
MPENELTLREQRVFTGLCPECDGVINSEEISSHLSTLGFSSIDLQGLSLTQQIALFRNANHINAFIVALGLTMMVEGLNLQFFGHEQVVIPSTLSRVFRFNGITVPELRLYVIVAAILLVAAMMIFVEKTKTGQAIRAVAENRDAAILMGVNVKTIPLIVFGISTSLGVAAGIMVGALFAIAPGIGEGLVVKGFAVLILGGLGSFPGAILGGTVLGITESIAAGFISSAYKDVIAFVVMILVLLFRPQGLLGRAP